MLVFITPLVTMTVEFIPSWWTGHGIPPSLRHVLSTEPEPLGARPCLTLGDQAHVNLRVGTFDF
jgi:hypothetical protein